MAAVTWGGSLVMDTEGKGVVPERQRDRCRQMTLDSISKDEEVDRPGLAQLWEPLLSRPRSPEEQGPAECQAPTPTVWPPLPASMAH